MESIFVEKDSELGLIVRDMISISEDYLTIHQTIKREFRDL